MKQKIHSLTHSVHIKLEEKLTVVARRDGGLETMEMHGQLTMRIADESFGRIKLQLKGHTNELVQLQTHPNIDRELLKTKTQIALKNPARPFPSNTDVGVLKWRIQTTDESNIPLSSKCDVVLKFFKNVNKKNLLNLKNL